MLLHKYSQTRPETAGSTTQTELGSVFFSGPLRAGNSPPSFEFPPQTITNFVCFLDIFQIFSPHKINFPPKTTTLEKTLELGYTLTEYC